jgi:hypothetical protein
MPRLCLCGQTISPMSHANIKKCRACRERDEWITKESKRRARLEATAKEAKQAGLVQLHSCLGNAADHLDAPPPCLCRKYVSVEKARELIRIGQAVDFESRQACFHQRCIVETSRVNKTPRGATIEKAHILRGVQRPKSIPGKTEEQLKAEVQALERRIQEDQLEKSEDERHRWEVWSELQREFYVSLTKQYSEADWLKMEQTQKTLPVYISGIGHDERSSTGKTKSQRIDDEDTEEYYAKAASTKTESNTHAESAPSADTNVEDEISIESLEAVTEAEEMAEAA